MDTPETCVTMKYPRGWSFGKTDNISDPAKMVFRLDRDLYLQARSYSGPWITPGWINRYIEGMRKWFSVQDILDGFYDGIIDTDPRNRPEVLLPLPPLEEKRSIERLKDWYYSLEDIAEDKDISLTTVKRWAKDGAVFKVKGMWHVKVEPEYQPE